MQPALQRVDGVALADRQHFHAPVLQVLRIAPQAQPLRLFTGAAPVAAEGKEFGFTEIDRDVPEGGFGFHNLNFVTPETENTTHYFWSNAYQVQGQTVSEEMTELSYRQIFTAFHQDWEVFNKQQENWDDKPTIDTIQDAGSIAARAMIDRKIAAEQGEMAVAAE